MASRLGERAAPSNVGGPLPPAQRSVWVLVGALLLAGLAGFVIGSQRSDVVELVGRVHVGDHMASIESDGWFYGVSDSVAWIDASGSHHDDGWPECLGGPGTRSYVRFGAVAVPKLGIRAVVYVDCSVTPAQGS